MKQLYFIRHGQSTLHGKSIAGSRNDVPLDDTGKKQSLAVAKQIKPLGVDLIVSSPMIRAMQTATIVADEIGYDKAKIVQQTLFIERDFGELDGKPYAPDINLDGIADLESVDELTDRARFALNWLKARPEEVILVISHGSFGRALRSLLVAEYEFDHPSRLANGELHRWL